VLAYSKKTPDTMLRWEGLETYNKRWIVRVMEMVVAMNEALLLRVPQALTHRQHRGFRPLYIQQSKIP